MKKIKLFNLFKPKNQITEVDISPEQSAEMWKSSNSNMLLSATYYSCMQVRCNAIAKMPLKLLKRDEKGTEKQSNNQLYDLLKLRPNRFTNAHDFIWATEFQRLEYGNAYWYATYSRGEISALYLLDSRDVSIIYDNIGLLSKKNSVYYAYNGKVITEDSIVHFKNYSLDGVKGRGIKKYLSDTINTEIQGQNVIKEKYETGLQDPIIVQYTGDLNDKLQSKIKQKFSKIARESAGQVIPIPTDFGVSQLETKLVNSQFFELQGLTSQRIANAFGVKSFQLNDLSKSTYANITEQNRAFYSDTLQNVLTEYEQEIDYKLLTTEQRKQGMFVKFNTDVLLASDLSSRYKAYSEAISSGYMTIKEVRDKEELPYIEGTDRLILGNGASIPLSEVGNQYKKGGE